MIAKFHYDEILLKNRPAVFPSDGYLFALWPSPVNHDGCFEKAGFKEFADNYDGWDKDFEKITREFFMELKKMGKPLLISGEYPRLYRSFGEIIIDFLKGKKTNKDSIKCIIGATHDDINPPCVFSFGEPPKAILRTADGHEIFFLWLKNGDDFEKRIIPLFQKRFKISQMHIEWDILL